jgi:hypothetical protein
VTLGVEVAGAYSDLITLPDQWPYYVGPIYATSPSGDALYYLANGKLDFYRYNLGFDLLSWPEGSTLGHLDFTFGQPSSFYNNHLPMPIPRGSVMSDDQKVIVGPFYDSGHYYPLWQRGKGLVSLGLFHGTEQMVGIAVSPDGQTIIGRTVGTPSYGFMWTPSGGYKDLPSDMTYAGVDSTNTPNVPLSTHLDHLCRVTNYGLLAFRATNDGFYGGFWTPQKGFIDLAQYLTSHGVTLPGVDHSFGLFDLSADGTVALGYTAGVYAVAHLPSFEPPTCRDDRYSAWMNTPLKVAAPGVLGNDVMKSAPTVALATHPSHAASFALNQDGSFSYQPVAGFAGVDHFVYRVTNEGGIAAATATILVEPQLSSLKLAVSSIAGGNPVSGKVTLQGAAFGAGSPVKLSSSSASAPVPAIVNVPAGSSAGSFSIATRGVDVAQNVTITAVYGQTFSSTLTLMPAQLSHLVFSAPTLYGGQGTYLTAVLTGAAGPSGAKLSLSSGYPSIASVPSTLNIVAGQKSAYAKVATHGVLHTSYVRFFVTMNSQTLNSLLTLQPAVLNSVTANATTLRSTQATGIHVNLLGSAPSGGAAVQLSSSNPAVLPVPTQLVVGQDLNTAAVGIAARAVTAQQTVTVTATYAGASKQIVFTVNP